VLIDPAVTLEDLRGPLAAFWPVSGAKIANLCASWDPANGSPVFTVRGRYTSQGLDRVDAGLPVRMGDPAIRRHRGRALPRARTARNGRAHGAARLQRRRPRPRLQQRLDVRQPVAPDARGPPSRRPVGARVLRARAQGLGRGAGGALAPDPRGLGLHLLVQRPAVPVRRHDPFVRVALPRATSSATSSRARTTRRSRCCAAASSMPRRPRAGTSSTARGAIRTTSGVAWPTRASSTSTTAGTGRPRTQQGYSAFSTWTRGLAWITLGYRSLLEFWTPCRTTSSTRSAAAPRSPTCCSAQPGRHATSSSPHRIGRCAVLGYRRRRGSRCCPIGA
jgi:hypothetical protein